MKPRSQEKKSRFRIEKLEERIAPARGGVPGPDAASDGNADHGQDHADGQGHKIAKGGGPTDHGP